MRGTLVVSGLPSTLLYKALTLLIVLASTSFSLNLLQMHTTLFVKVSVLIFFCSFVSLAWTCELLFLKLHFSKILPCQFYKFLCDCLVTCGFSFSSSAQVAHPTLSGGVFYLTCQWALLAQSLDLAWSLTLFVCLLFSLLLFPKEALSMVLSAAAALWLLNQGNLKRGFCPLCSEVALQYWGLACY